MMKQNIVIGSLTKNSAVKTIARIRNPEYTEALSLIKTEMDIDHIVNPELSIANEISRYLLRKYDFYSSEFCKGKSIHDRFSINDVPEFIGKKVLEIEKFQNILIMLPYQEWKFNNTPWQKYS